MATVDFRFIFFFAEIILFQSMLTCHCMNCNSKQCRFMSTLNICGNNSHEYIVLYK
ncbi:hypothetical protein KC19_10G168900 [Ceratodon purpureus]|uniref:Uncharacterized protein n=1 Tax=Ceratodon purpureus TaxID=3225 RepID=A0A8T0GRH2_CERPU|nr:hypothetical protein KC19_10G168900 [Ceratodon purpureus]